jgi:hypothetical protein
VILFHKLNTKASSILFLLRASFCWRRRRLQLHACVRVRVCCFSLKESPLHRWSSPAPCRSHSPPSAAATKGGWGMGVGGWGLVVGGLGFGEQRGAREVEALSKYNPSENKVRTWEYAE